MVSSRSPAAAVQHRFLFNFSVSYRGGGYKRAYEFAKWFDANGGAWFALHPGCEHLVREFPHNRYFLVRHSHLRRLLDDWTYLKRICRVTGRPDLYYAYGIPIYYRVAVVNWSHLNNILVIGRHAGSHSLFCRIKYSHLGRRFRAGFVHADVVSAESAYSLAFLRAAGCVDPFMSVNGSDDELAALRDAQAPDRDEVAAVVGTYTYKALAESLRVFEYLREDNPQLRLSVIGSTESVPDELRNHSAVTLCGLLPRREVIERLSRCRFFICSSYVENSYNSAAEGIFLAEESYISDIGPHRELLAGEGFQIASLPQLPRQLLHVRRAQLLGANLRSWGQVVADTIARTHVAGLSGSPGKGTAILGGSPLKSLTRGLTAAGACKQEEHG